MYSCIAHWKLPENIRVSLSVISRTSGNYNLYQGSGELALQGLEDLNSGLGI